MEEELEARKDELVKVEQLEEKLDKEAAAISESLETLQEDLEKYANFEVLAEEADARQERLQNLLEGLRTRGTMLADVADAKESMVNVKAGHLMVRPSSQHLTLSLWIGVALASPPFLSLEHTVRMLGHAPGSRVASYS